MSVQNQVNDAEQQENIFDAKDKVSLAPKQVCEDQVQLQEEVEMEKSNEQKVETNVNGLMNESLLHQSGELEMVMSEEKSMEAKFCKGNFWSTIDHDHLSSSFNFILQEFDDFSSKDAFDGLLSIRGSEHQDKLEECVKLKKPNFFPFDVGDEQDLRTNPLQEEGNDEARRSWISVHGPRINDDMG